jgi:hypothetical protein
MEELIPCGFCDRVFGRHEESIETFSVVPGIQTLSSWYVVLLSVPWYPGWRKEARIPCCSLVRSFGRHGE